MSNLLICYVYLSCFVFLFFTCHYIPGSHCAIDRVCVSSALRPVDSDLCLGIPPNTTQLCHISCPVECEVSAWSAWGPCTYENCQDQAAKKGKFIFCIKLYFGLMKA